MSGSSTPGAKPEKTMSSRLLTMKFMQRAAHSAANTSLASPSSDDRKPTSKRQRLSTGGPGPSPATPRSSDLEAISAAIAAEEEKRAKAVARQAAEAGETEWVLDFPGANSPVPAFAERPYIVPAESLDAEDENIASGGRRSYGNFKRKNKPTDDDISDSSDPDTDDFDENDLANPSQIDAMIQNAKTQAAKKKKKEQNKPKPLKLWQLTSISGGGESPKMKGDSNKARKKRKSR